MKKLTKYRYLTFDPADGDASSHACTPVLCEVPRIWINPENAKSAEEIDLNGLCLPDGPFVIYDTEDEDVRRYLEALLSL